MQVKLPKIHSFTDIVLLLSVVLIGGFNEYVSCILSVIICGYIFFKLCKEKQLILKTDLTFIAVSVICVFYGLSCFWAIDSGMAFIGFLKFLPVLLYLVAISQNDSSSFEEVLPVLAAALTVISFIGMKIGVGESFFSVAGRLAGFFQYPNTFALFLLICELLIIKKTSLKIPDFVLIAILSAGVFFTGSRTVFILFFISNAAMIFFGAKRQTRKILILVFAVIIAVMAAVILLSKGNVFERFLNISFKESTFVGRILYFVDALPLLIKYPFGMGYLGYSYIQNSIQTGLYSVRYVHNDFLQLFLDVGFIPALLFIAAIIRAIFSKNTAVYKKIIILTLCAHSWFDFNLQFIGMFFILILLLNDTSAKKTVIKKKLLLSKSVVALLLVVNIYMGIALGLAYFEKREASEALYPFNTDNKIAMLESQSDVNAANLIAEEILKQNTASYIPYSIKSKYAYSKGEFTAVIRNKQLAIAKNPLNYDEYEEYCKMLINGIILYNKASDSGSVKVCQTELLKAKAMLESNESRLSKLGKMIKDQPVTEFSEEILNYINAIE